MSRVTAKKIGNVAVIHVDGNGRPVMLSSFDDNPVGSFPFTCRIQEAHAKFGPNIHWFEEARVANPEDANDVSDEQVLQFKRDAGAPPTPPAASVTTSAASVATTSDFSRLVAAFSALLTEYRAGAISPEEVQAVGTFLINALPEIEEELEAAKTASVQQRKVFKV